MGDILLGYSAAVVAHHDAYTVIDAYRGHDYNVGIRLSVVAYILDRIGQEIDYHPHYQVGITEDKVMSVTAVAADLDLVPAGVVVKIGDRSCYRLLKVKDAHTNRLRSHRQDKEILDDILHPDSISDYPVAPSLDLGVIRHIIGCYVIYESLRCPYYRKRRLEFVRYIGGKVLLSSLIVLYLGDIVDDNDVETVIADGPVKDLYLVDGASGHIVGPDDTVFVLDIQQIV